MLQADKSEILISTLRITERESNTRSWEEETETENV